MFEKVVTYFSLFLFGGASYYYMEVCTRGYSHISMLICGGICFLFVGEYSERLFKKQNGYKPLDLFKIAVVGAIVITGLELITGVIVNQKLNLNIWNYRELRANVKGQICPMFTGIWAIISLFCAYVYRLINLLIPENKVDKSTSTP